MQIAQCVHAASGHCELLLTDHEAAALPGFPIAAFGAVVVLSPSSCTEVTRELLAALLAAPGHVPVHVLVTHAGPLPAIEAAAPLRAGTRRRADAPPVQKRPRSRTGGAVGALTSDQQARRTSANLDLQIFGVPPAKETGTGGHHAPVHEVAARTQNQQASACAAAAPQADAPAAIARVQHGTSDRAASKHGQADVNKATCVQAGLLAALAGRGVIEGRAAPVVMLNSRSGSCAQQSKQLMASLIQVLVETHASCPIGHL